MNQFPKRKSQRVGSMTPFIVIGVVAVALIGFAAYYGITSNRDSAIFEPITAEITRGEFVSQVLDQGEVQSSENIEIRCEARARNGTLSVLSVTPEGTRVKPGDFLVQLDSTSFEKELEQQNIALVNAETRLIQAESALASAKATKDEYVKGTFEEEKLKIQNDIEDAKGLIATAKQRRKQAEDTLVHSRKLQAKGFITNQALESAGFDLDKAEIELTKGLNSEKLAVLNLRVLEDITFQKNIVQYDADIKAAVVKLESEEKALAVEKDALAEIQQGIELCTIKVPAGVSGQVVYAKESSRGGTDWVLEEGTSVRQNQVLIRLPNPDKMEVKALINEQSITLIEPGMPATIKVDALNNTTLKGIVTKVNQYAESSGWMSSSIRKYAVFVRILDPPPALKPGMNAAVTIQVQYEPDVLLAPVQTIYAVQDEKLCLVRNGDRYETRNVVVGGDNSQMVYIKSGVEAGDTLIMNPGAYPDLLVLPEIKKESKIELPEGTELPPPKPAMAGGPGGPGGPGAPGGGAPGGAPRFDFGSLDTNGDGSITKDELPERMQPMFDRLDSNTDGTVDKAEFDDMMSKMRSARGAAGGGPGGGRGAGGGPGGEGRGAGGGPGGAERGAGGEGRRSGGDQ